MFIAVIASALVEARRLGRSDTNASRVWKRRCGLRDTGPLKWIEIEDRASFCVFVRVTGRCFYRPCCLSKLPTSSLGICLCMLCMLHSVCVLCVCVCE